MTVAQDRNARLAAALRANLRRRKAAPPSQGAVPADDAGGTRGSAGETGADDPPREPTPDVG